jgi:hypothetical protein
MSEEIVAPQGDAGGEVPVVPQIQQDGAQLAAELEAERTARKSDQLAYEGRLKKEQDAKKRQAEVAAQYGVQFDSDGQVIGNPAFTPTGQQPVAPVVPEPETFDWDNMDGEINRRVDQRLNQLVPQMVGLIDKNVEPVMRMSLPDFENIKTDLDAAVKALGFQNMTHLRAVNPAAEQVAINSARGAVAGRAAAVAPVPVAPTPAAIPQANPDDIAKMRAEADRLERLQSAAIGGGSAPASPTSSKLIPEQKEHMEQLGYTSEAEYLADMDGVCIKPKSGGNS